MSKSISPSFQSSDRWLANLF